MDNLFEKFDLDSDKLKYQNMIFLFWMKKRQKF